MSRALPISASSRRALMLACAGLAVWAAACSGEAPKESAASEQAPPAAVAEPRAAEATATASPLETFGFTVDSAPRTPPVDTDSWPAYRGIWGDGWAPGGGLLAEWPAEGPPVVFKRPIGAGYSSFALAGGRAYTLEESGEQTLAAAIDLKTGARLWSHPCDAAFSAYVPPEMRTGEPFGTDGPRSTPAYDNGRLYVLGPRGGFHCLNAETGEPVWQADLLKLSGEADPLQWGFAASPLVRGGFVYVTTQGRKNESLLAFDAATGERKWAAVKQEQAYTSPLASRLGGREQILNLSLSHLNGVDAENGKILWSFPFQGNSFGSTNCSQPLQLGGGRIFLSSGWGKGAAVIEVTPGADGKVAAREIWANLSMKAKFNPPVLAGGYVYGLDEGILVCLDPANGKRVSKGGRYGYGQIIHADGKLIILTEGGELVLLKMTPAPEEISRFQALEGTCWTSPALAGGMLVVRNSAEVACFDLRAAGQPPSQPPNQP